MIPKPAQEKENLNVKRIVENIIRCKWSLSLLHAIRNRINRPGAMQRNIDGLTTKVMNERLRKLVRFGILRRVSYPEIPPRVEYEFTDFGKKFLRLLDQIEELENELEDILNG
ncbi:MAG: transcriptional regulator [Blastocatellia bacterium]